jgi:hypothetical protein
VEAIAPNAGSEEEGKAQGETTVPKAAANDGVVVEAATPPRLGVDEAEVSNAVDEGLAPTLPALLNGKLEVESSKAGVEVVVVVVVVVVPNVGVDDEPNVDAPNPGVDCGLLPAMCLELCRSFQRIFFLLHPSMVV